MSALNSTNRSNSEIQWTERSWLAAASGLLAGLMAVILTLSLFSSDLTISRNPDPDKWMRFAMILIYLGASACSVILGVVALVSARKRGAWLTNAASARAGISVGSVATLFAAFLVFNFFASDREMAEESARIGHVMQLCIAMQMYSEDNGGKLPPSARWRESLREYIKPSSGIPLFPKPNDRLAYAMNSRLGGVPIKSISHPEKTILISESTPGKYLVKGPDSFPMSNHDQRRVVGLVGGFADIVATRADLPRFKWSVK
ncbi:MAG: hypothetical protein M1133_03730 [Armatimonadetes bacterium]|nr:hypothetical protein [Armatimonadota bacterium]